MGVVGWWSYCLDGGGEYEDALWDTCWAYGRILWVWNPIASQRLLLPGVLMSDL
ncbi:MAG: hypothetical protein OXI96_01435 [Acidimicrobiaceae bacterium]|nr:hypothetical protein [Acidimicrobiaceae bacterium]